MSLNDLFSEAFTGIKADADLWGGVTANQRLLTNIPINNFRENSEKLLYWEN
ncbi:hypothetical protein [Candidatus Methylomicrobium oryzae]|jgi:hypothetical protein|uniref:hypothetical protein n=1 Tax=Candidatus Methylomicrobium oryzae TaxID=2802053 RepID=UPI0019216324|nr:hypothetical protein [Methylomicrobium sp. RS1]MBL1265440.1 hypothetical protein [Methylomicrobium sp. RS1]